LHSAPSNREDFPTTAYSSIAWETSMNIKPLGDRLVIRRFEADEKTTGGIILPDGAKEKPQKGKVVAVGPGKLSKEGKRTPLSVKEGDTVLFTNWAGDEFKKGAGDDVLLMREEDVLAVLES
jgi:chaperonin GroES